MYWSCLTGKCSGAMENWGLITYRESALLVSPQTTPASIQYVASVVCHELAHQWFGNIVTMVCVCVCVFIPGLTPDWFEQWVVPEEVLDLECVRCSLFSCLSTQEWWTDLWLNEGFASWIEYPCLERFLPEFHTWQQIFSLEYARALSLDALKTSHPIEVHANTHYTVSVLHLHSDWCCLIAHFDTRNSRQLSVPIASKPIPRNLRTVLDVQVSIREPREADELFDTITYSKGASVINMLYSYLGLEVCAMGECSGFVELPSVCWKDAVKH